MCVCVSVRMCVSSPFRVPRGQAHTVHLERMFTYYLGWPEPYIYGVYTVIWQENHHIYGHIRCI